MDWNIKSLAHLNEPHSRSKSGVTLRKIQSSYELKLNPPKVSQANYFPARKSSYIGHMRNQAFVNNVRLRFLNEDGTLPEKCVPRRSQSAPVFSSTTLRTLNQKHAESQAVKRKCKSASHARVAPARTNESDKFQDGCDSQSSGSFTIRRSLSVKKFYGRLGDGSNKSEVYPETNGAFFKVIGSAIKPPLSEDSHVAYLSLLRQENKRQPCNGIAKNLTIPSQVQEDPVARERLDYEKQTGHLLEYYTKEIDADGLNHSRTSDEHPDVERRNVPCPSRSSVGYQVPCCHPVCTASRELQTQNSHYCINLSRRMNAPDSPFILISRQAVLHDKVRRFTKVHENPYPSSSQNGVDNKCKCSVCQSDLNLHTSRLTLSPDKTSHPVTKVRRKRDYWVNPSGPMEVETFCEDRPNSPAESYSSSSTVT